MVSASSSRRFDLDAIVAMTRARYSPFIWNEIGSILIGWDGKAMRIGGQVEWYHEQDDRCSLCSVRKIIGHGCDGGHGESAVLVSFSNTEDQNEGR